MLPIYGKNGQVVAWRLREVLYDLEGNGIGIVRSRSAHMPDGTYIGHRNDGVYRNGAGEVIGFEPEATAGFLLPLPSGNAIAPMPKEPPPQVPFDIPAPSTFRKLQWARRTMQEILAQASKQTK